MSDPVWWAEIKMDGSDEPLIWAILRVLAAIVVGAAALALVLYVHGPSLFN